MDDDAEALALLVDAIQDGLRNWLSGGGIRRLEGRYESWGFVGVRIAKALTQLRLARGALPTQSPTFLECGSGLGIVGALARSLGFEVTAVELVPRYIELSRGFFPAVRVEEGDLRTYDRYGEFDVVYYYAPFGDVPPQVAFERRIEAALRPGAIVIANGKLDERWRSQADLAVLGTDDSSWWVLQKKPAGPGAT